MDHHAMQMADDAGKLLQETLERALEIKKTSNVEPPLSKSDLAGLLGRFDTVFPFTASADSKKHAVETAVREAFNNILASTTIDSPSFVNVWNLFDILSILSDDDKTEPAVMLWLVEELLESQTIAGCRKIFDYLESRRERIIAKNFASKNLVILRSCNELLKRLSRAEDTAFCGRVFIFMFQSFPLGDKSSVNLRGEFHVENVTTFDAIPPKEADPEQMDIDTKSDSTSKELDSGVKKPIEDSVNLAKGVTFSKTEKSMSADELYPIFWALQQSFSQPKKLFDAAHFSGFKSGLEATLNMFKSVESTGRPAKVVEDGKRGTKRKRGQGDDDLANAFNPKYLTSRDLFELEISDLSFRRHILVQVLIVMDFLLSLSAKAKERLSKSTLPENPNRSVMYADQLLNEEDTKWALDMKKSIAEYLKQGSEGAYFYRMVETVLSRDKNWARWKIVNCPSIANPAITAEEYAASKVSARKATTNKKLRPNPIGSLDLKFLSETDSRGGLDRLKDPARYQLPPVKSFKSKIELDDMDIEMAMDDESKNAATESKASKSWRAQRIASTTKLAVFDKIERSDKIDVLFQDDVKPEEPLNNGEDEAADGSVSAKSPKDRRPVVISGLSSVGNSTIVTKLFSVHEKSLGKNVSHTTKPPGENESNGVDYHFVDKEKFSVMRDGDQFLEYSTRDNSEYGTSRKAVEGIIAQGKVPVLEMDMKGVQQLKDQAYNARFVFIGPSNLEDLEARLEIEQSKVEGFYDLVLADESVESAYKALEAFVLGQAEEIDEGKDEVSQLAPGNAESQPEIVSMETDVANGRALSTEDPLVLNDAPPPPKSMETDADLVAEQGDATATPGGDDATK
ncbi:THO complex subunit 1 transcription elongation factor-domain-containing protein [Leptodontidium sp. 2 PMI_412]|nr:THO complex subunit 1 transcription elongation factor-domain-containing protein [Leptodontidium sp. 2 PMI_412]